MSTYYKIPASSGICRKIHIFTKAKIFALICSMSLILLDEDISNTFLQLYYTKNIFHCLVAIKMINLRVEACIQIYLTWHYIIVARADQRYAVNKFVWIAPGTIKNLFISYRIVFWLKLYVRLNLKLILCPRNYLFNKWNL